MTAPAGAAKLRSMHGVLVATDGSPSSDAALEVAIDLAEETSAPVTVVHVRPPVGPLGEPHYQRRLSFQLAEARRIAEHAVDVIETRGLSAEVEILEGDPASGILSLAESRDPDVVVVGSRGRGAVARALLGGVSRAVVEGAHRPVLVVRDSRER